MKYIVVLTLFSAVLPARASAALDIDRLSSHDIKQVQAILKKLSPLVQQRRASKTLVKMTFDELYKPLEPNQKLFLDEFKTLDANAVGIKMPFRGIAVGSPELVMIKNQKIRSKGNPYELPVQFLPTQTYNAYSRMMDAMQADLGKRLYVESGYRSSAYQLYLFVLYLKNHSYSIRETAKFVALPGYSEHGDPNRQAIDFINENGINQDDPKVFVNLPEYSWLLQNAARYGFVLSYPKDSAEGITFEPWHWRYEGSDPDKK